MSIVANIVNAVLNFIEGRPLSPEAMAAALDAKAAANPEKLDWRNSIVDLMKLTGQDSSLPAREQLAQELGYEGAYNGSAEMNIWLHQKVMDQLSVSMK